MSKKLIAALLAVCMIVGMMVPVSAADGGTFTDVAEDHWAAGAIQRWAGYGVLNGNDDGTFAPERVMTRAEFAQMLVNMMGYTAKIDTAFTDVADDAWYAEAISAAAAAGIVNGFSDGTARPSRPVTFEEAAVMLCRALGLAETTGGADWSKESIEKLTELGMIGEDVDEHLVVGGDCDRAVVAMLASSVIAEYVDEDREEPITGEVKGVILVVDKASVEIEDAVLSAPIVVESACAALTNTTAKDVKLGGTEPTFTADAGSKVEHVSISGSAPSVVLDGEVASVTIEADAADVAVAGDGVDAGKVTNDSAQDVEIGGEIVKGRHAPEEAAGPDGGREDEDSGHAGSISGGGWPAAPDAGGDSGDGGDVEPAVTYTYEKVDNANHKKTGSDGSTAIERHSFGEDGECTACGAAGPAASEEVEGGSAEDGHEHTWMADESREEVTASCTADGKAYEVCTCGAMRTITTPATGHPALAEGSYVSKAASCFEEGEMVETITCEICHAELSKTIVTIPATGEHVFTGAEWAKDDTQHWHVCTTEGCTATDAKAGHSYSYEDGVGTCMCGAVHICGHDGAAAGTCPICGKVLSAAPADPPETMGCDRDGGCQYGEGGGCTCGGTDCRCPMDASPAEDEDQ